MSGATVIVTMKVLTFIVDAAFLCAVVGSAVALLFTIVTS